MKWSIGGHEASMHAWACMHGSMVVCTHMHALNQSIMPCCCMPRWMFMWPLKANRIYDVLLFTGIRIVINRVSVIARRH